MVRVQFHKGDAVWFVMPEADNTMARAVWVRAVRGGGIIQLVDQNEREACRARVVLEDLRPRERSVVGATSGAGVIRKRKLPVGPQWCVPLSLQPK